MPKQLKKRVGWLINKRIRVRMWWKVGRTKTGGCRGKEILERVKGLGVSER